MNSEDSEQQRLQIRCKRPIHVPKIAEQQLAFKYFRRNVKLSSIVDLEVSPMTPRVPSQRPSHADYYCSRHPYLGCALILVGGATWPLKFVCIRKACNRFGLGSNAHAVPLTSPTMP